MLTPMRLLPSLAAVVLAVAPLACRSAPAATEPAPKPSVAAPAAATDHKRFGAPIEARQSLALADVLSKPDDYAARTITVEAKVRRNCTRRGCWMELSSGLDPSLPGCRVTFKDYGFFVPLDSAGSTAKVEGTVEVTRVGPDEVAHLESEGARFAAKQPDGTAREVRLVASGVELWREPG
jgi:hypothetical protein